MSFEAYNILIRHSLKTIKHELIIINIKEALDTTSTSEDKSL